MDAWDPTARNDAGSGGTEGGETVWVTGQPGDRVHAELRVTTDPAKIEEMKARLRQMAAMSTGASPAAASNSQVDQLSKLADLHDRGALTDAEFAAEKAKILGEG